MKMNSRKCQTAHAQSLLEPAGFSQLVLVLDLSLKLLLPPAVSSNGAAFLQLSTISSGEGRWLNLQIQRSRGFFTRTSQQPLTGSHRCWTCFEQAGTNGTPTSRRDARNLPARVQPQVKRNPFSQPIRISDIGARAAVARYDLRKAKHGLVLAPL